MEYEKAKVMLQYIKVLLLKHGYHDKDLEDAMDMGIEALEEKVVMKLS